MKLTFPRSLYTFFFLFFTGLTAFGQSSVLSHGNTFKIAVSEDGVYKITHGLLEDMGFDPSKINPANIHIFGNEGGMLPQANSALRPMDLTENAILVAGEADGKFDPEDYILFYGEGAHKTVYNQSRQIFSYQNNLYADKNYYFVQVNDTPGKRIEQAEILTGDFPVVNTFQDYVVHEVDDLNLKESGREWWGESFENVDELPLSFDMSGIVPGSEIKVVSHLLGRSYQQAAFKLFMNGTEIIEQPILAIIKATYALQGYHRKDTIVFNESTVGAATKSTQEFLYRIERAPGFSVGNLDLIFANFHRTLALYGNQTIFHSTEGFNNAISTFRISNAENISVWDITNSGSIKNQTLIGGSTASFSANTETLKKFIAFNNNIPLPELVGKVDAQNLRGLSTPNLIVITNPLFEAEAQRLAGHRTSFSGWITQVVTIDKIYNEFSSGRQDVTAIRDFIRMLNNKSPGTLKAVLMFGRGSFDYKDRMPNNTNFVPTYESRNSLHPLQTYSSDDFFGFLEESEGEWNENPVKNHTMDVGVGRLPVTKAAQAKDLVDKIIRYDSEQSLGYWRKEIVFVADDGSHSDGWTSLHQFQANSLANQIEDQEPGFDTRKLFIGTYRKKVNAGSEEVPELNDDIHRTFRRGALIINFTGHGSERQWTDEEIFNQDDIEELDNDLYPFMVTATCEFGRQDNPGQFSSAERCVTKANGGVIGLVTTARPVNATTNFDLNSAFYEALFNRNGSDYAHIGEVFRNTKNNSISGVSNRNFSLLGDPSMKLAIPANIARVTSIKSNSDSDTLKALSKVTVKGQIESSEGQILSSFNGKMEAKLYDKETNFTTIGRNNPEFQFKQWHNILFHGQASVNNGEFEFSFILPKNIAYNVASGKLSLYGYDKSAGADAKGIDTSFKIGGGESNPEPDNTPPIVTVFMGDSTFINGGIVNPDTRLVARLVDNHGINISDYGIGNGLIAILDDSESFILNDYFISDKDDHTSGWINFPLIGLPTGRHKITVKAWDVYNNPAEASVEFIVTDGETLEIEDFGSYPNPFNDQTTLFFTHNRSGDDFQTSVTLYSTKGDIIATIETQVDNSDYRVDLLKFDREKMDKKLPAGLYLARLVVRSLSNGSKNEKLTKLIILN